MIDKSVPYYPLTLYKTDTKSYPVYRLPDGYTFAFYQKGDETAWADLECSLGQFKTLEDGLNCFRKEFLTDQNLTPEERMLFVKDAQGEIVATATLWDGVYLGVHRQRIHWVAVSDRVSGKGIAKALLTRLFELYHALGYEGFLYLLTGTRYYPAVALYRKFGFTEYRGDISPIEGLCDSDFRTQNEAALAIVDEKLKSHRKH